jgi:hypothetical protein
MYTATQQAFWREPVTDPAGSDEAYTPPWLIDAAPAVLGDIDVDPASCATAQQVVQAGAWYGEQLGGLAQHWRGRMWVNPPFSEPLPWVKKAIGYWRAGDVSVALLLVRGDTPTEYSGLLARAAPGVCFLPRVDFWPQRIDPKASSHHRRIFRCCSGISALMWRASGLVFDRYGPIR